MEEIFERHWNYIKDYFVKYPRFECEEILCKFYKKCNKGFSFTCGVFLMIAIIVEAARILTLFFETEGMWGYREVMMAWIFLDLLLFGIFFHTKQLKRQASLKQNKTSLKFQESTRKTCQRYALLPTILTMCFSFFLSNVPNKEEMVLLGWMVSFLVQAYISIWLAQGLAYKIMLMIISNTGYNLFSLYFGVFKTRLAMRLIIPVFFFSFLVISIDRKEKENFLYKLFNDTINIYFQVNFILPLVI